MNRICFFLISAFVLAGATQAQDAVTTPATGVASKIPDGTVTVIVVVVAALTMIFGMCQTFGRLKALNQGFGPNSLKALGLVLFLPTLLIVSVTVVEFKAETLAALLGTVAGYVLSQSKGDT